MRKPIIVHEVYNRRVVMQFDSVERPKDVIVEMQTQPDALGERGWMKTDEAVNKHIGLKDAIMHLAMENERLMATQALLEVDDSLVQEWLSKAREVAKSKGLLSS